MYLHRLTYSHLGLLCPESLASPHRQKHRTEWETDFKKWIDQTQDLSNPSRVIGNALDTTKYHGVSIIGTLQETEAQIIYRVQFVHL